DGLFVCLRRQILHVAQPSEEAPDAQRHSIHDPDRRCGGGDLGSEVTGTSTVPAMYQGSWLRPHITGKLQCLLQSRPSTRRVVSMGRTTQPQLVYLSVPRRQDPVR